MGIAAERGEVSGRAHCREKMRGSEESGWGWSSGCGTAAKIPWMPCSPPCPPSRRDGRPSNNAQVRDTVHSRRLSYLMAVRLLMAGIQRSQTEILYSYL